MVLLGAAAATVGSPALAQMAPMGVGGPDTSAPVAPSDGTVEILHGIRVEDPFRPLEDPSRADVQAWIAAQDRQARALLEEQSRAWARSRFPAHLEPVSAIGRHAPRRALVGIVDVRWHQGAELARDPRGDRRARPALDRSQHHGCGRQRQPVGLLPGPLRYQGRLSDGGERRGRASAARPRHPQRRRPARSPRGLPLDLRGLAGGRQFLLLRAPAAALRARGVGPQQPSHLPSSAGLPAVRRSHGLALPAPHQRHDDPAPVLRDQPADGVGRVGHR